jgi:N-acetylglucosaminyldiphosphoundecaprenol N-acetyl-beta-D-mannosaminyltransferase
MTMTPVRQPVRAPMRVHAPPALQPVAVGDLTLRAGSLEEVTQWLEETIATDRNAVAGVAGVVAHVNVANCWQLLRNPRLAGQLGPRAHLLFDGVGMRIGARILGLGDHPAVNGTDLFPLLMARLAARRAGVFLLGGRPGIADAAAGQIAKRWAGVRVVGSANGYFDDDGELQVCARIAAADPDVVMVGLGFGRQEEFAIAHRHCLPGTTLWTVGGLFDFVSGAAPRAPVWMRDAGLEWLFRLAREPGRMFWRNFVAAPSFLVWCAQQRLLRRPGS